MGASLAMLQAPLAAGGGAAGMGEPLAARAVDAVLAEASPTLAAPPSEGGAAGHRAALAATCAADDGDFPLSAAWAWLEGLPQPGGGKKKSPGDAFWSAEAVDATLAAVM